MRRWVGENTRNLEQAVEADIIPLHGAAHHIFSAAEKLSGQAL